MQRGINSGGGGSGSDIAGSDIAAASKFDWKVADAINLACLLCAGPNVGDADWRSGRSVHAYFVGDVLKQLVKIWWPEDVSALMTSLQNPQNFPAGSAAAPRRIISEVMEGLGADYSVVIGGRSHDQESTVETFDAFPDDESRL
jgi:hypothetical protein